MKVSYKLRTTADKLESIDEQAKREAIFWEKVEKMKEQPIRDLIKALESELKEPIENNDVTVNRE